MEHESRRWHARSSVWEESVRETIKAWPGLAFTSLLKAGSQYDATLTQRDAMRRRTRR